MVLLPIAVFAFISPRNPGAPFYLVYFGIFFVLVAGIILWQRRYGRMWKQYRAKNWRKVQANFDEGEIVAMRKGRSNEIAGYQVWLGYEYYADGEQAGVYTLPFSGEFPTQEEAKECRKSVANQSIVIYVSPRNPKRSAVLDEDVKPLLAVT